MIDRPEEVAGLQRAMRRSWALAHWIFDNSSVAKMIVSQGYGYVRSAGAKP
jgi:hypothetical protein